MAMPSSNTAKGLSRNKFIEIALSYTLSYISYMGNSMPVPLDITILADSGYYSQSSSWTECAKNPKSSFIDFNSELADAHKTGLGSSAALVTAFVAALLKHHTDTGREAVPSHLFKNRVHNLAQIAHCAAQGKIGSGFDVAAAVFGSCIYRRFSPSVIERIGDPGHANFSASLRSTVDDGDRSGVWDSVIDKPAAILPQRLRLVMCDVDCGTETPSMVRKVMSWRKEQPEEALRIWHGIQSGIDGLIAELRKLDQESDRSIDNLRETISAIRCLVREMSVKARVPIEPGVQGDLIDACSQIDGIVGGVVPGAGGYDAIALIIEDREEVLGALKTFLQSYQPSAGSTDEATIGVVRVLSVRQDSQGLEFQPAKSYIGWLRE